MDRAAHNRRMKSTAGLGYISTGEKSAAIIQLEEMVHRMKVLYFSSFKLSSLFLKKNKHSKYLVSKWSSPFKSIWRASETLKSRGKTKDNERILWEVKGFKRYSLNHHFIIDIR